MKKILFLLIACFTLGASAPLSMASAQTQTATAVVATDDSLQTDSLQQAKLAEAEKTIDKLTKKIDKLQMAEDYNDNLIAVVGIFAVFGLPFFLIIIYFYFRWKSQRAKLETFNKMVESGQTISPESYRMLVEGLTAKKQDLIQKGIRTLFIGIGLTIFLWWMVGDNMGSVGIFVACIGLGEIVAGYFSKKDKEMVQQSKEELVEKPKDDTPAQTDLEPGTTNKDEQ